MEKYQQINDNNTFGNVCRQCLLNVLKELEMLSDALKDAHITVTPKRTTSFSPTN